MSYLLPFLARSLFFPIFLLGSTLYAAPQKVVNVYGWAHSFTSEVLEQFEKETGIKVNYDVYDSPEVMETNGRNSDPFAKVSSDLSHVALIPLPITGENKFLGASYQL